MLKQTGDRVGKLVILEVIPGSRTRRRRARCECDCGRIVLVDTGDLGDGTNSCGCLRRERMTRMKLSHNLSRSVEYGVWHNMKNRCYNSHDKTFHRYGGRGITVCDRWRDSFANFIADVGPRPSINHSLDRIDNNGPYAPENCRWATSHVQSRNRAHVRMYEAFGKRQCLSDWAREYGLAVITLHARLRKGVPIETALTAPLNDRAARSVHYR